MVLFDYSRENPTNFQIIWNSFEYTCNFTLCFTDTTRINVFWCMTRGNPSDLQPFDLEIDRTFHRGLVHNRNPSVHPVYFVTVPDSPNTHVSMHSYHFDIHFETDNMDQPPPYERTMSQSPEEEVPYVVKVGLIHLLEKFHGVVGEDPCKHLK